MNNLFFSTVAMVIGLFLSCLYYDYTKKYPEYRKFAKAYIGLYGLIGICFLFLYAFIGLCFIGYALGIWLIELNRGKKW